MIENPSFSDVGMRYRTIVADPPWRFTNRTGKVAPEHARLGRYQTMSTAEIAAMTVPADDDAHLYLWVPNALLPDGLHVMQAWGFKYKTNLIWHKTRQDGGSDGRGVGFYFRNTTEMVLFGVRGCMRTLEAGRRQVNLFAVQRSEHSVKPDCLLDIVERCSPTPWAELFSRRARFGWNYPIGDQALGGSRHDVGIGKNGRMSSQFGEGVVA